MALNQKQDDDRFWQRLVLPEEDRRRLCGLTQSATFLPHHNR